MSAPVVAVVVHWQDPRTRSAASRASRGEPGVDVLVVDNGSREPVGELLARRAPGVACLRSAENRGYAGGANLGIRAALGARRRRRCCCSTTTSALRPGATAAARARARRRSARRRRRAEGPGARGPAAALARVGPRDLAAEPGGALRRRRARRAGLVGASATSTGSPAAPCGCARRRSTRVGLLDETFFAYHEEVDWCTRARRRGLAGRLLPDAVVTHTGRGTAGGTRSVRIRKYFGARNTILFARKHAGLARVGEAGAVPRRRRCRSSCSGTCRAATPATCGSRCGASRDALAGRRPPLEELGLV